MIRAGCPQQGWAWDLVICHPVFRFLANSGALRLYLGGKKVNGLDIDRWAKMRDGAQDFRRLFFIGEYRGPLCVENSVMHGHAMDIITGGGGFDDVTRQIIQPFNFKEDASKATTLWLRGLPQLKSTGYFAPRLVCKTCGKVSCYDAAFKTGCVHCGESAGMLMPRWSNQTDSGQNRLGPSDHRSTDRARTYQGIAEAMAEQWGSVI